MNENLVESGQISRRSILRGIGVGGALAVGGGILAACGSSEDKSAKGGSTGAKVDLQLDWIPFGRHAPFYAAKALGYYEDAGVDITLRQGSGVGPGYSALVSGNCDVSFDDLSYLPKAVSDHHAELVATAVFYSVAPHSVFYFESSGIKTPKDLEGKTIAYSAGQSPYLLFPAFAKANGVDASKVKWQQVTAQALNQTFLTGQADAMVTYALTAPVLEDKAPKGETVKYLMYGDYGVPLLNNGLIFTKAYIDKNPKAVRGITQATAKGYQYAFDNPEAAVKLMKKAVPTINIADGLKEIAIIKKVCQLPEVAKAGKPLGWIDPAAMEQTISSMTTFFKVDQKLDTASLYTNEYLA